MREGADGVLAWLVRGRKEGTTNKPAGRQASGRYNTRCHLHRHHRPLNRHSHTPRDTQTSTAPTHHARRCVPAKHARGHTVDDSTRAAVGKKKAAACHPRQGEGNVGMCNARRASLRRTILLPGEWRRGREPASLPRTKQQTQQGASTDPPGGDVYRQARAAEMMITGASQASGTTPGPSLSLPEARSSMCQAGERP